MVRRSEYGSLKRKRLGKDIPLNLIGRNNIMNILGEAGRHVHLQLL